MSKIRHFISEAKSKRDRASQTQFQKQVAKHKFRLAEEKGKFSAYGNVLFVFQTFNKCGQLDRVLQTVLNLKASNVIVFADGCIDDTSKYAHELLPGKNHLVISSNDTHEIRNYRLAISLGKTWGCEFAVLLQDDDVYTDSFNSWLDAALKRMQQEQSIAIIGGNGGANIGEIPPKRGDHTLPKSKFVTYNENGLQGYRLGPFEDMILPNVAPSLDGSSNQYVATVNRAPQIIRIETSIELGFFPNELEPFQYDDYYNCFKAWLEDHRVLLMPISGKNSNVGTGGMRLYNSVNADSRPIHFIDNWNFIYDHFADEMVSGRIMEEVNKANVEVSE